MMLPNAALFYSLHDRSKSDPAKTGGWSISRYRWYLYIFAASFIWYWIPGFIWQGLSVFAFVTWIKPNNVVVNQLFGGFTGLSLIPVTFDWTYITAYLYSPLIPPWHAIANTMIGLFVFVILTAVGLQYTNAFYGKYLPMSDSESYDNTQNLYNVSRILSSDYTLDLERYREYSPLFLSSTFAICYGLSFASIISVIVHTVLYHWREIKYRYMASRDQHEDIHLKLMRKYPEAPDWWYVSCYLSILRTVLKLIQVLRPFPRNVWSGFGHCTWISDPSDVVGLYYCLHHFRSLVCECQKIMSHWPFWSNYSRFQLA